MLGNQPSGGDSNLDMIIWDSYNAAISSGAIQISTEPTSGASNTEQLLWDLYQAILTGGGGGGGGLPSGSNGDVLIYASGSWQGSNDILDSSAITAFSIDSRLQFDADGVTTINNIRRRLFNSSGAIIMDWEALFLNDKIEQLAIDIDKRAAISSSGIDSVDWENRYLINELGNTTLDYELSIFFDASGVAAIDADKRKAFDITGVQSMDFNQRVLVNNDVSEFVLNWDGGVSGLNTFFYPSINVGFGTFVVAEHTHPIVLGTPGIRFTAGLDVAAPAGSAIGGLLVNVNGTDRVIPYFAI